MKLSDEQVRQMKDENPPSCLWFLCFCGDLHPWLGRKPSCPAFDELIRATRQTERLAPGDLDIQISAR